MAKKKTNMKATNARQHTTKKVRTAVGTRESSGRKPVAAAKQVETIRGMFQDPIQSERALNALRHAGLTETHVSLIPMAPRATEQVVAVPSRAAYRDFGEAGSAIARLAGGALAMGSMAMAAPVMLALPVLGSLALGMSVLTGRGGVVEPAEKEPQRAILVEVKARNQNASESAARILHGAGARDIRASLSAGTDLQTREYRDEAGEVHHHTRSYMRDHAGNE